MIASVYVGLPMRPAAALWATFFLCVLTCVAAQSAQAADCPGHPDAIGTSRTLVVDPREHPIIGSMQYAKTLPLADHEVVLTFDDGPLPKYSYQILDILAAQCVKATFFLVGRQANANPEGVRKVRDAGHTIATHTQNHPSNMQRLPIDRAQKEIEDGIASVTAALADGSAPAPFFRIPGLGRSEVIEEYTESKGIQIWSADFPADDWRHVSSQRVYDLAIQRLEAKGKGILLLHDIQPRTVAALPRILRELKARGYRIVHVVPAMPERPATPTEPPQWQLNPPSEMVAISRWPKIPNFVLADRGMLSAPRLSHLDWRDSELLHDARHPRGVPLPPEALWPRPWLSVQTSALNTLPVPAPSVFKFPEAARVTLLATNLRVKRPEQTVPAPRAAENVASAVSARSRVAAKPSRRAAHQVASPHAGRGTHGATKPAATAPSNPNGRAVRVASLKKR
jgi:peptidoglycan/xylan/chitin deacetylase (PgdA/CDA1 family)